MVKEEKQLKKMSDYHRKQSGFSDDDAPPTPQAYEERKDQYDSLADRVSNNNNYSYLRDKIRSKKIVDKEKPKLDIERLTKSSTKLGWSKKYSDGYDLIFNK